jgi:hypothetical protein
MASIRACKFDPEPETNTAIRIGVDGSSGRREPSI